MGKGQRMRSTRRLMKVVEERRDLAALTRQMAHELEQSDDAEDRRTGKFWRDVADAMHHETELVPRPALSALRHLHRGAQLWDQQIAHVVKLVRAQGASWAQIGAELGISGEGARRRYGDGSAS